MELTDLIEILTAHKTVLTPNSAQLSLHILELLEEGSSKVQNDWPRSLDRVLN